MPRPLRPADHKDEPLVLDDDLLRGSGGLVAEVVQAVLAEDHEALRAALQAVQEPAGTRAAAAAAAGVLTARLPALSGVEGPVLFDEDQEDLLHAYADLLAERAEVRRARLAPDMPREQLLVVAHLAAVAAIDGAAGEPSVLVLGGMPAEEQLLAGVVLLAQTCADGGGPADHLSREVADLFG